MIKRSIMGAALLFSAATSVTLAAQSGAAIGSVTHTASADQAVEFDAFLPLRNVTGLDQLLKEQTTPGHANYHKWLTPAEFGKRFGPSPEATAQVVSHLRSLGFEVASVGTRSVHVAGSASTVANAFGAPLQFEIGEDGQERLVAARPLTLSPTLASNHVVIPAFGNRHMFKIDSKITHKIDPKNRYSPVGPYWFTDQKQAYEYPSYNSFVGGKRLDGTGANVAILMSGDVLDSDTALLFNHEKFTKITGKPVPTVQRLLVNGGAKFDPKNGGTVEASLDVQQVFGSAPGASVTLVSIPSLADSNTISGYLTIVESNSYDIVSSSFGGCEKFNLPEYNGGTDYRGILETYNTLFKQGNAQGITFIASSGDSGGLGCPDPNYFNPDPKAVSRFTPGVEFPASSPHVTSVGGTNLVTTSIPKSLRSRYVSENALGDPELPYDPYGIGKVVSGGYWGAGGGVSAVFRKPPYQTLVVTGSRYRTVPDIGMHVGGCPFGISVQPCGPDRSAGITAIGGGLYGLIGTSLAAPEFAGALALYVQVHGRQGNFNNYLYAQAFLQAHDGPKAYHRHQPGFDGVYGNAYPPKGYNYLVGVGTPRISTLLGFDYLPLAGDPQTPSNP